MTEIIPAIMPTDWYDLEESIERVAKFVKTVQIDVMDGKFVSSRSWPYVKQQDHYFQELQREDIGLPHWQELNYEIDMMVNKPEDKIDSWILAGASRVIIHVESTKQMNKVITEAKNRQLEIGIALNIDTPISDITGYLEDVAVVQFMGIAKIGYQGEAFDERVLDKIREFHNAHPEVIISIDGGVSFDTASMLLEVGAKRLVSGSAILHSENPADAISQFKKLIGREG